MVLDLLAETPLLRGLLLAVLGVGFWVAGVVVAYFFWRRYRESEGE